MRSGVNGARAETEAARQREQAANIRRNAEAEVEALILGTKALSKIMVGVCCTFARKMLYFACFPTPV
jgi:hypothetical protein